MNIDPGRLERAKGRLRKCASALPKATCYGIDAEAFDHDDLLLMLRLTRSQTMQEQEYHERAMKFMAGIR